MKTIKVKNKTVSYSEELKGNTYSLKFNYIKPANAHNNAIKIEGTLDVFFNIEEKVNYEGRKREITPSSRLFINNKYILSRSKLYKDNEKLYLSEWVSDIEYTSKYSSNILTESDAKMINVLISDITKNSELFTYNNITPGADAQHMSYELKKADENIKEYLKKYEDEKINFNELLLKYNLSLSEYEAFKCFTGDGMAADEAIKAARALN
jgi:hypothetical protein